MSMPPLPPGYTTRPATVDDLDTILALYHAVSMALVGEIEDTIEQLRLEFADPELDIRRDTIMIEDASGRLAGYAVLSTAGRPQSPTMDIYIHPDRWERDEVVEPYLIDWAVCRTRENLAVLPPDGRLVLHAWMHATDVRYAARLQQAGFVPIRHFFQMAIDFDGAPIPPVMPDGLRLRIATRDEDWHPIFDARRDAWRDHYGFIAGPYDKDFARWKHYWDRWFSDGCWLLLEDDSTVAAICLCQPSHNEDETTGWVSTLAVRRAYRKRGLASALLRQAFVILHGMGKSHVGLGVDASSPTGAVQLYERAGMRVSQRYAHFELELRPGTDTAAAGA